MRSGYKGPGKEGKGGGVKGKRRCNAGMESSQGRYEIDQTAGGDEASGKEDIELNGRVMKVGYQPARLLSASVVSRPEVTSTKSPTTSGN